MKRIGLCAAAVLCALSVGLFGCSNSGSGAATTPATQESFVGTDWALDPSNPMAFEAYMFFEQEDSTAALIIGGAEYDGTWAIEDSKAVVKLEDDNGTMQTLPLAMQGDKLVLGSNEGSKLVFVKDQSLASEENAEGDAAVGAVEGAEEMEVVDEVIEDLKEPIEVADDDSFKVTVTGKGTDFTGDPGYQLTIENKTKKLAMVMTGEDFTIDGKAFEAGSGDEIEAGQTAKAFIYFDQTELKDGVEGLKNVKGTISIIDEDTEEELGKYEIEIA